MRRLFRFASDWMLLRCADTTRGTCQRRCGIAYLLPLAALTGRVGARCCLRLVVTMV